MDNEKNKIEYSNSLDNKLKEYSNYNEYNDSNYANRDYDEFASFKEYNDNKSTLKYKKLSSGFVKLLSSAMVIVVAAIVGTDFIFGPKSKVSEVFIEGYDTNLFISVMFSEYDSNDELELVVKNDFTRRTYEIEAFEEGNEEEKQYFYFQDVNDLKSNVTYNISIISGANVLYSQRYTIKSESITNITSIYDMDVGYSEDLIFVNISFNDFNIEDDVRLELAKNEESMESIFITEAIEENGLYHYSNSFSVIDNGDYFIKVYINDNLVISKLVSVNNILTHVLELSHEYYDMIFNYYLDFDSYSETEVIVISLYQDDELIGSKTVDNITNEEEYYMASGEIEGIVDGIYTIRVTANDEVIYEDEVVVGYIYDTVIENVEINNEDKQVYIDVEFSEYSENEKIDIEIYKNNALYTTINVNDVVNDGAYYYSTELEFEEYGDYFFNFLINGEMVYEKFYSVEQTIAVSVISDVKIYAIDNNLLVLVDIESIDPDADLSIEIINDDNLHRELFLLEPKEYDGMYYASFVESFESSSNNYSYKVLENSSAIAFEGKTEMSNVEDVVVTDDSNLEGSATVPYIACYIEENSYEFSFLIYDKSNNSYPEFRETIEYMEGTRFFYSLGDYEDGDYVFILICSDGLTDKVQYWYDFSLGNGG